MLSAQVNKNSTASDSESGARELPGAPSESRARSATIGFRAYLVGTDAANSAVASRTVLPIPPPEGAAYFQLGSLAHDHRPFFRMTGAAFGLSEICEVSSAYASPAITIFFRLAAALDPGTPPRCSVPQLSGIPGRLQEAVGRGAASCASSCAGRFACNTHRGRQAVLLRQNVRPIVSLLISEVRGKE